MFPTLRHGSLRVQIILWSFVPTAIVLVTVALVTFQAYRSVTEDLVVQRDREVARLTASQLDIELSQYSDTLFSVARTLAHTDIEAQRASLHHLRQRLVIFDAGVIVLNNYGRVVAAEPERPELIGKDLSDRPYFRQIDRTTSQPYFSDIVPHGKDGADVVVVAVPIIGDRNESPGIIAGMFEVKPTSSSAFYGSIVKLRAGNDARIYLVDSTGRAIYHSDIRRIGEDLSSLPVVSEALSGKSGALRTSNEKGEEIVTGFAPVPHTPWNVITEENWSGLIRAESGYRESLLVLLALGVIIPAMVVTIGVRRITQPIVELIGAAQEVAAGNFGRTLVTWSRDEIGELTEQFNIMSMQLQQSYSSLERKVADRTRELATLNAISRVVSGSLELDEILQNALDKTQEAMQMEVGQIFLLEEESQTLVALAHRGLSDGVARQVERQPLHLSIAAQAAREGRPIIRTTSDYSDGAIKRLLEQENIEAVICVPLLSKGKMMGAIHLSTRSTRLTTPEEISLLAAIGQQIGVAVENARLYQAEKMRLDEVERRRLVAEGLRDILAILNSNYTLDKILDSLAAQASRLLGAEAVSIHRMVSPDQPLFVQAARGLNEDYVAHFRMPLGQGTAGIAAITGEPVPIPDITEAIRDKLIEAPEVPESQRKYVQEVFERFKGILSVPLIIRNSVYGAISLLYATRKEFTEEEIALAVSFADQTALAIENARLYEAEQTRRRQADTLLHIASVVGSTLNLDEVLNRILNQLRRVVDYDSASIQLLENDNARVIAARGYRDVQGVLALQFSLTEALPHGKVVETGRPLNVTNVEQEFPTLCQPPYIGVQSWLGVPLQVQENIIGLITLERHQPSGHSSEEIRLVTAFADQAALAIENAQLYQQAEQLAVMEERSRLARELHDSVTQSLYSLTLLSEAGRRLILSGDLERVSTYLNRLGETSQQALKEMRLLVYELRPLALEQEGLIGALQQRLDAVEKRAGMNARLLVEDEVFLPVSAEEALYRVAQESLNNALKHASATSVTIRIMAEDGHMVMEVIDDGKGFDRQSAANRGGMGLITMQERIEKLGGTFTIHSTPGSGTTVRTSVRIPNSPHTVSGVTAPFHETTIRPSSH